MDNDTLLERAASAEPGSIERTLWIVALVQAVLDRRVVLIGGAAHNLYTGDYRPTDIDLAASGVGRADFELHSGDDLAGLLHRLLFTTLHVRQNIAKKIVRSHRACATGKPGTFTQGIEHLLRYRLGRCRVRRETFMSPAMLSIEHSPTGS